MKRILMLLFASVCALCTFAQTYDEADLVGKWNVTSLTGEINNTIISFESLYLEDTVVGIEDGLVWLSAGYLSGVQYYDPYNPGIIDTLEKEAIDDFFISNLST